LARSLFEFSFSSGCPSPCLAFWFDGHFRRFLVGNFGRFFFNLPAHLSAKSHTLVTYFGLEDLEILKRTIVKTQKMALHVGASFFISLVALEVRLL